MGNSPHQSPHQVSVMSLAIKESSEWILFCVISRKSKYVQQRWRSHEKFMNKLIFSRQLAPALVILVILPLPPSSENSCKLFPTVQGRFQFWSIFDLWFLWTQPNHALHQHLPKSIASQWRKKQQNKSKSQHREDFQKQMAKLRQSSQFSASADTLTSAGPLEGGGEDAGVQPQAFDWRVQPD